MAVRVTVWNEDSAAESSPQVLSVYPQGVLGAVRDMFDGKEEFTVRQAWLSQEEAGLPQDILDDTDVLIWWGHCKHDRVPDAVVSRVQAMVLRGMGLIVLHSGHESKIFQRLMGTQCSLRWHEMNDKERLFVIEPTHPIMRGVPAWVELEAEEMYGERFDIPAPDELLMIGWYESGDVFRSACTFRRGYGKIFYFQPGHETLRSYHNPHVIRIIQNAARWAARDRNLDRELHSDFAPALEEKK